MKINNTTVIQLKLIRIIFETSFVDSTICNNGISCKEMVKNSIFHKTMDRKTMEIQKGKI